MSEPKDWKPGYPFLALCIVLLAVMVFVVGTALTSGTGEAVRLTGGTGLSFSGSAAAAQPIVEEAGPFRRSAEPSGRVTVGRVPSGSRHLDGYYARRAYPGAPPYIPHEVTPGLELGGNTCNACHLSGGFTESFDAFAPVTPHPEFLNCRQCHVTRAGVKAAFKGSRWAAINGPPLGQSALGGSPPRIPHSLQLRGYCVACHAGQGAVAEIATSHPERGNCRQCHVPAIVSAPWERQTRRTRP